MACQKDCPANAEQHRTDATDVIFSKDETAALLADGDGVDKETARRLEEKLEAIGFKEYPPVLGRNLRALVANRL